MRSQRILCSMIILCTLVHLSCGGSAYGKISTYSLNRSYGSLQTIIDSLNEINELRLVCSPRNPCRYDSYGNQFYVVVPSSGGSEDSLSFIFTDGKRGSNKSEIRLMTGKMPFDTIIMQAGNMTRSKRKEIADSFEGALLPLIVR